MRPPLSQPQRPSFSHQSGYQNLSNLQPKFAFTNDTPRQNAFASSSSISDNSCNDPRDTMRHQSNRYASQPSPQNSFMEEPHQEEAEDDGIYQRPQNARVGLKKNTWTNQTQLCFRPVKPPAKRESSQPRATNQINRRYDPSPPVARTPMPRPMQPYGYAPMQQNTAWMIRPMPYPPSRMQQPSYSPPQQSVYYHGQMVPNHIVEQELRARAAESSTAPDVKPMIHRRQSTRNDMEQENDDVECVDRRQALYPGVYEQDDGELRLQTCSLILLTN
ncbi:uncharacterized protein FA14DRAFT_78907 [Meira miltonrushii]|uniref:Uncharacterized protein n=1 Tax=Meira miltonrushii TaxID=1280837 RepID=A0A316V5L9_9BASI|nr:uncharacterized protein FA14DRAFT_78907 [Meira miltonrushii]PWN32867.1 hypothetical protein FA14DRAFT_78907 [Meira miltonrushii]